MRNGDLQWTTAAYARLLNRTDICITATSRLGTPTAQLAAMTNRTAVIAACIPALDDPDRFQAAQVLLIGNPSGWGSASWIIEGYNEMEIALPAQLQAPHGPTPFTPTIDPGQRHHLELLWHHRKDDLIAAIPLWPLLIIPSAIVLRSAYRNRSKFRRRRPAGTCVGCGYNLTGNTSGICPECGTKLVIVSTPAG